VSTLDWLSGELQSLRDTELFRGRKCITPLADGWCESNGRRLRNLAGNDYLNLAHDPRVISAMRVGAEQGGSGVTASALVTGRSPWHQRLEESLARFQQQESALLFPTGYAANLGTVAALIGPEDVVFCDRLNHACLVDGCRLSGGKLRIYRHSELAGLERQLKKAGGHRRTWIVTDSLFSMDGDLAPLVELCDLAERHGANLIIDEAHALGILGAHGRGAAEFLDVESRVAVRIGTLSKAAASLGGFVTGSRELIDWLWNRARTQMFSTALPVPNCLAGLAALEIMIAEPERRQRVVALAADLRSRLRDRGLNVPDGIGPIVPVILKAPETALACASYLESTGFLVAAIRPPTVPNGSSRLRITINAALTEQDLAELCAAIDSPLAPRGLFSAE